LLRYTEESIEVVDHVLEPAPTIMDARDRSIDENSELDDRFFCGSTNYIFDSTRSEFYQGQTIQIMVGFAAGGGFDTYSRVIARHLGRIIPGNPNIIVMNTPGAGSLIAANQLYKAKPDGLMIGNFVERRGDSGSWAYGR
jgi:hypothetical protein